MARQWHTILLLSGIFQTRDVSATTAAGAAAATTAGAVIATGDHGVAGIALDITFLPTPPPVAAPVAAPTKPVVGAPVKCSGAVLPLGADCLAHTCLPPTMCCDQATLRVTSGPQLTDAVMCIYPSGFHPAERYRWFGLAAHTGYGQAVYFILFAVGIVLSVYIWYTHADCWRRPEVLPPPARPHMNNPNAYYYSRAPL